MTQAVAHDGPLRAFLVAMSRAGSGPQGLGRTLTRPSDLGPGDVSEDDIDAMMESRPMSAADLTTAEDAAARSIEAVLEGAAHVITHGDVAAAVAEHRAELDRALARLGAGDPPG